jgi:beta-N-acetylhexosaminidase
MRTAMITGLAGTALLPAEAEFLREVRPAGLILFARNLVDHAQTRALIGAARDAIGEPCLVLIDQEGGRVQRLRPPLGRALPPAAAYGWLYEREPKEALEAAFAVSRLLAEDLKSLGIDTNCTPVLDLPVPGAHAIIGDRAYGQNVAQVVALARAVMAGHMAGGVLPVVKHIPGHGRAAADSHLALPVVTEPHAVLSETDFAPFKALNEAPAAMTAHVVFSDIDETAPASVSGKVMREIVRGEIGFAGLVMSDDLSMQALKGAMKARAEKVIAAGSDLVLHCNGDMAEMAEAAAGTPPLAGAAETRFLAGLNVINAQQPYDRGAAERHLARVLAIAAGGAESV